MLCVGVCRLFMSVQKEMAKPAENRPRLLDGKRFVTFNGCSGLPFRYMSTIVHGPVTLDPTAVSVLKQVNPLIAEHSFPSVAHAWTALKATNQETLQLFASDGSLAKLTPEAFWPFSKHPDRTHEYWSAMDGVGVLAELAGKPKHAKALGIIDGMDYGRELLEPELERAVWLQLLRLKYEQNPRHLRVLRATHSALLVAHDPYARHWGGRVEQGQLVGDNAIGRYTEQVRAQLG